MKIYKLKPDREDLRDKIFRPTQFKSKAVLPKSMDLRVGCSPIVDQGQLGSCTANAIASGLKEFWEKEFWEEENSIFAPLSRLWFYWEERNIEGTISEDAGAEIRDGMKVLQQLGCAPEVDWPYDITKFTQTPPTQATADAVAYNIAEYHRVTDLISLKTALAEGYPVVLGIDVYESFESDKVAQTGIVPIPKRGEQLLGGHAILAVGYKDKGKTTGYVTCRNSWGAEWGDKGYFYLPYSYFKKYVSDMWTGK